MTQTLDHALEQYRGGTVPWEKFVFLTIRFVDYLMRERHRIGRDERAELISDFYPRLQHLVEHYREQGSSFEGYLASTVFHFCRAHVRKKIRTRRIETGIVTLDGFTEDKDTPPALVSEAPIEPLCGHYEEELKNIQGPGQPDTLRRQLLFAFCKNIPLLEAKDLDRYGKLLNMPTLWISTVREYAARHHAERLLRRTILQERRDAHYAAMIALECRMKKGLRLHECKRITRRYDYHRRLWLEYIHRLRVQNVHLSHRDLAALFGIPKGSVDSAVFVLTRRLVNATAKG